MKITIHVSGQCECGWYLMVALDGTLYCENPDCEQKGKKFKRPTIDLEEVTS